MKEKFISEPSADKMPEIEIDIDTLYADMPGHRKELMDNLKNKLENLRSLNLLIAQKADELIDYGVVSEKQLELLMNTHDKLEASIYTFTANPEQYDLTELSAGIAKNLDYISKLQGFYVKTLGSLIPILIEEKGLNIPKSVIIGTPAKEYKKDAVERYGKRKTEVPEKVIMVKNRYQSLVDYLSKNYQDIKLLQNTDIVEKEGYRHDELLGAVREIYDKESELHKAMRAVSEMIYEIENTGKYEKENTDDTVSRFGETIKQLEHIKELAEDIKRKDDEQQRAKVKELLA